MKAISVSQITKSYKSICKISSDNKIGTGFFCKIPNERTTFPVIMTLLSEKEIKKNSKIYVSFNNKKFEINNNDNRMIYSNKSSNITIIEIIKKDDIKNNEFLEVDDILFEVTSYEKYLNNYVYIMTKEEKEDNYLICKGTIVEISNDNRFFLSCGSQKSTGGGLIIKCSNNKVIGINFKSVRKKPFSNVGIFIKEAIQEFNSIYNNKCVKEKTKDFENNQGINIFGFHYLKNTLEYLTSCFFPNDKGKTNLLENEKVFLCRECKYFPIIKFINYDKVNIICSNCHKEEIQYLKNISGNILFSEEKKNNEKANILKKKYLNCLIHEKKYKYYCEECQKDICKKCCLENNHYGHKIKIFDSIKFETNVKIESIKELLKGVDFNLIDSSFESLVNIIINLYKYYPCYNIFITIDSIYQLLLNNNNVDSNDNYKEKKFQNIITNENINKINPTQSIFSIKLELKDFDAIKFNKNLLNLEILELQNNNIKDLSPFKEANLKNLKFLNLSNNIIDDKNSDYLMNSNLNKLFDLNMCSNNLCNYSFFEKIIHFPNLRYLFVSSNKFNDSDFEKYKNTIIDLSHLEEIGLSDGVFSDKTIELLDNFKLDNLKILYLNRNELKSTSFIENIKCSYLEEVWLNDNNLSD